MQNEKGNALWFILLAIALLAGLTILMSRTGSMSEETGSQEREIIRATEILRYAASIEQGIQFLMSRGCSENELSFWHDSNGDGVENASDSHYNPKASPNRLCHIFSVEGAGLQWKDIDRKIRSTGLFYRIGTANQGRVLKGVGSDSLTDLYFYMGVNDTSMNSFCDTINKMAGVGKMGNVPPPQYDPYTTMAQSWASNEFVGDFWQGVIANIHTATPPIIGKKYFCVGHGTFGGNTFLYLLLGR